MRKGGRRLQSKGCLKFKRVFGYNQIFIKNNRQSELWLSESKLVLGEEGGLHVSL